MVNKEKIEKEEVNKWLQNNEVPNFVKNYIEQLEHEKDIMQRSLALQKEGWNEGARLFAQKQDLIERLEEDCKRLGNYEERKKMDSKQLFGNDGMWAYAKYILSILKGE